MDASPVVITDQDLLRIRRMLDVSNVSALSDLVANLTRTLERATQVRSDRLGAAVVTLDSQLSVENLETGSVEEYTLVLPGDGDQGVNRPSVLAPLGCQVRGRCAGDLVHFQPPGGGPRWVRIKRIHYPPRAANPCQARRGVSSQVPHPGDAA